MMLLPVILAILINLFIPLHYLHGAEDSANNKDSTSSKIYSEDTLIKTQEISDSIMSPYCPGRTLSACPSDKARNLRNEISIFFERGYTRDAVIRQLKGRYGSLIIGEPGTSGAWVLAWITPSIILLSIIILIVFWTQYYKKHLKVHRSESSEKISKELENELKNRLNS